MTDPTDTLPLPAIGTDEHEALLRFDAARRMVRYGDRARRLGIDPDKAAEGLVAAGLTFLVGAG